MSIRVTCPNGHELKVKSSLAGKSGLCPFCRALVHVPVPKDPLEDSILDMLGSIKANTEPPEANSLSEAEQNRSHHRNEHRFDAAGRPLVGTPKKTCVRCHAEIDLGTHICPHCHTYIATMMDFGVR